PSRREPPRLDAGVRALNERLLADIHPHVRDATTWLGRKQENVSGLQSFDERRDFGSGARLVSTHARQANAVLAVGPLHHSGAIESVRGGTAPDIGRTERVQRVAHDVGRVPGDRSRPLERWPLWPA